jgi:hypothetical protein
VSAAAGPIVVVAVMLLSITTMPIGVAWGSPGARRESFASTGDFSDSPGFLARIAGHRVTRPLAPVIQRVHRSTVNQIMLAFEDRNADSVEESFFAIQRSVDGRRWGVVPVCHPTPRPPCNDVVPGNPGTGTVTVWDEDPPMSGMVYYRVVQANLPGNRRSAFYLLSSAEVAIDSTWKQLSIMCRLPSADDPDLGFDVEVFTRRDVMEMMWRTRDFWGGISNGHFDVSGIHETDAPGDVTGWIVADDLSECKQIVGRMGYDDRLYDNTTYIHSNPGIVDCTVNFPVVAFRDYAIGKSEGWSEERLERAFRYTVALYMHEFGHNLLLNRVTVTECGSAPTNDLLAEFWPQGAECTHSRRTAQSVIDVLGVGLGYHNSGGLHAIGMFREVRRDPARPLLDGVRGRGRRTEWEARACGRHRDDPRPKVLTVAESGTYGIEPMMGPDGPSAGIKALRVERSGGTILYLEYRRSYGFDAQIDAERINLEGALLHIRDGYPLARYTTLIDPIGPTDVRDAVLPIGAPWTDDLSGSAGATYEVLDHDEHGLIIDVEFR